MCKRGVEEIRKKLNVLENVARMLNARLEKVVENVEKLKKQIEKMEKDLKT